MSWTEADSDALFRHPPEEQTGDDSASVFDGSREAMRRLRHPFETNGSDSGDPGKGGPAETSGS